MKNGTIETGVIAKVLLEKGFGFISIADRDKDLFFHVRDLDGSLPFDELLTGRRVEFSVVQTPKGPRAAAVHAAD